MLGVGDVTQSQNNAAEFELAKNAIYKMNGVVPYSLVRGNHDNSPEYNNTFNNADYTSQFEGFYNDKIENSYRRMTIGDTKYLFITLDYGPEDEVLDWAGELCATYPDHKVIITTHAYLYADGTTIDTDDVCDPITMNGRENNGETIWNKLGRKYENIFMIISGHISSDRVQVVEAEGDNGNIVTQMLVDFQSVDSDYGYGSVGVVTMLYFSEDGKQVEVEAYSPIKQAYFREDNQFTFDIEKKTIVYHDFEGVEMGHANNGYGSFATVANNGGLGITDSANVSVVDGKMVCNFVNGNLVDLQLYNCGYADTGSSPINKDFVLSFDVQIGSTSASYGSIAIRDNIENKWLSPISLNSGKIHLNGVGSAELSTSELTHVEIVFNYDATATNSDSTTGAFTSVTLIVGGKQIGTAALNRTNGNFKYINHFRMFQDNNGTASLTLDNIYVGYGKGNRGAEFGTELYNVDFVGMTIPNEDSHQGTGFKLMNSFDTAKGVTDSKTNITYKGASYIANDIVSVRGSVTGDARGFIDLNLNDIGKKLSSGDAVLSMKIRPYGDMSSKVLTRVDGTDDTHFDIQYVDGTNYIKVDGQSYTTGVALSSYRFSTVEIVLHYDYAKLQYTKVSLYVNGEYIGSDDLKPVSQITLFRLFDSWSWNNNRGVDVDEVTIVTGNRTAYEGETVKTEFIGYQTTTPTNDAFNLRLISIMTDSDLSKYASIGYDVSVTYTYDGTNTETETLPASIGQCNKVFTSVVETTEMAGLNEITAAELGGQYIFAINVLGISTAWTNVQFTVTTYYQLTGQEKTTERTFNFTVDAANSI